MTVGTVLVIDDHELLASSLTYVLTGHGLPAHRLPITDLEDIQEMARQHAPGVALLDLDLGTDRHGRPLDGVQLVAPLRAQGWQVLVVTGTSDLGRVAAAVSAGAANWVVKGADLTELITVTGQLVNGTGGLSEPERRAMVERHRTAQQTWGKAGQRLATLTAKEHEVLDHLTAGVSAADIAQQTCTSIRTVRAHIRSILTKLDVNSQGAATAIAWQHRADAPTISAARWRQLRGRGAAESGKDSGDDGVRLPDFGTAAVVTGPR